MSSKRIVLIGCWLLVALSTCGGVESSADNVDVLDKVKTWVKQKARSYGYEIDPYGEGGYGGGGYGGGGGGHHGYDDDDDEDDKHKGGLFGCGSGGIFGGSLMGLLTLGGIALLASVILPLLMMLFASPRPNPNPTTIIPTIIPTLRRSGRQSDEKGAYWPLVPYTPEFLDKLDRIFDRFGVSDGCESLFVCSLNRDDLVADIDIDDDHRSVLKDLLRLDLGGVADEEKIHDYQRASRRGFELGSCTSTESRCKSVVADTLKRIR